MEARVVGRQLRTVFHSLSVEFVEISDLPGEPRDRLQQWLIQRLYYGDIKHTWTEVPGSQDLYTFHNWF